MVLINRRKISLYDEAKAGFSSLVQQTAQVGLGLLTILLLTGGNPPALTVGLSMVGGIVFVAWSEQKRLTKHRNARCFTNHIYEKKQHKIKQLREADTKQISEQMTGIFTVGENGEVGINFLFDGGKYKGELAIFSLDGMDDFELGSEALIKEAASRALSHSQQGYIVISDSTEGASFSANLETAKQNEDSYLGVKTFAMRPGDKFGIMLVQNGKVQQVFDNPTISRELCTLFSLGTANPNDQFHMAQIADVTGDGNTFVMEDMRVDIGSDKNYNDFIFQIQGATGKTILLDEVINPNLDWRKTKMGKVLIACATPKLSEFPKENKPLIGVIDTGLDVNNHDSHILGLMADGIDINDKAPIWLGHVTVSSQWAESLIEFVEAAKKSGQPNAVVNLSLNLSQVNSDDSVTTRYELTPKERAALEYARQNNVVIVVGANNNGDVMSLLSQTFHEFDNIVTVEPANRINRESYSNYGYELDILASGGGTENLDVTACVDAIAKTSIATAKVTGVASLVWAANPQLTYRQVIDILQSTATDFNVLGWDIKQVLLR